jgi:hypothetical protein
VGFLFTDVFKLISLIPTLLTIIDKVQKGSRRVKEVQLYAPIRAPNVRKGFTGVI